MSKSMYIQLAAIRLKDGVSEKALLAASDAFQLGFVNKQTGVVTRMLLRGKDGSYADLVFFESKEAADRVARAEETSQECLEFLGIMNARRQRSGHGRSRLRAHQDVRVSLVS